MFYEANEPSSACRLWRIFMVETSTPPLCGTRALSFWKSPRSRDRREYWNAASPMNHAVAQASRLGFGERPARRWLWRRDAAQTRSRGRLSYASEGSAAQCGIRSGNLFPFWTTRACDYFSPREYKYLFERSSSRFPATAGLELKAPRPPSSVLSARRSNFGSAAMATVRPPRPV
jgi:hypothetical protein